MEKLQIKAQSTLQPFLDMSGYQPKTTFWLDFTIAEHFGENAIKDTFNRAFKEWKTDIVYLTELVMVLNWKMWMWDNTNDDLSKLYFDLWGKADLWCMENLKGEDKSYYIKTLD